MKYCLITFRSVTPAQRGEGLLRRAGIVATLQRTPRWMEEQGCGYSLRIWTADIASAVEQLRKAGVPLRRVYIQTPSGELEELNR